MPKLTLAVRQMACHPDLVLRGKTAKILPEAEEGTVCRLCNDEVSLPINWSLSCNI